ncbi:MAG TPA: DUF1998 domain-containing protein [Polyangiaceae bacterium]
MAAKKSLKSGHQPPDGRIRLSQIITTFGPGSMVDLLEHAVLVGGLDYWRYDKFKDGGYIDEPRLRDAVAPRMESMGITLSLDKAFRLPPEGDEDSAGRHNGIAVAEFPTWVVCQHCRALTPMQNLEVHKQTKRYLHRCRNTVVSPCVPVRFVVTCKKGHLAEFPWNWFVHTNADTRCEPSAQELILDEDPSGDFSRILVKCLTCGAARKLSEAREPKIMPTCRGERPWLGPEGKDEKECGERLQLLVRTASSAYFSQPVSALSIPDKTREILDRVSQADVWAMLQVANVTTLPTFRLVPAVAAALKGISDADVLAAVETVKSGKSPSRDALRTAEFKVFLEAREEIPGQLPPRDENFFACRLASASPSPRGAIERVVLVKKLRQVKAQIGLTRLSATPPNLQGDYDDASEMQPIGLTTNWLPASEIFGEGILLCLDENQVKDWESRPAVMAREQELKAGFEKEYPKAQRPAFPGARFYLLHSLSHLLMSSISLECGYSAAALGERIYCAPASDPLPMAAVLIMTGTSGTEGTLGGLVEEGRHLQKHLQRAWDMATLCSNDPVCAHHEPGDPSGRYLEGAACHGCLFVAEPACERFNRYLDRALVVPTLAMPEELAFFRGRP